MDSCCPRIRSGSSLQVAGTAETVEFAEVDVAGKEGVYLELFNASVSTTTGNGFDNSDYLKVYVALDGAAFSATPDIMISGDQPDNQVRYGMNGTAAIVAEAGVPVEKIFVKAEGGAGTLPDDAAPSKLQVLIPSGTATVRVKLEVATNNSKEVWCVEDVALYAAASAVDCDAAPLEGFAGEDTVSCAGTLAELGAPAVPGYTYSWSPAEGLSDMAAARPAFTAAVAGTYTYTVTATNGTCTYQDEVVLTVNAAPEKPGITRNNLQLTADLIGDTYEWLKDGEPVTGAAAKTLDVAAPGSYQVRVKNGSGCFSAYSEVMQVSLEPTAVPEDAAKAGISIYPNPARGQVQLQTKRPLQQVQILVLNTLGQEVYREHMQVLQAQQRLNLQHLPQGLYLVYIRSAELQAMQRLVIRR